jgi:thioredoxin reductase
MPNEDIYDVAIVGGGPAGLSAAIWLGRYLRRVVLVDSGDPRNWETRGVNGFLGMPRARPAEVRKAGRDEARKYDVTLLDALALSAERKSDDHFVLQLDPCVPRADLPDADLRADVPAFVVAKRLLLAIGIKDRWPGIPGLAKSYGRCVHVCPDCDGYEARDRRTVVLGTGVRATTIALALTTWTREIVVCTNGEPPNLTPEMDAKLKGCNIPVLTARVLAARSDDAGQLRELMLAGGMSLDCEKLFFSVGQRPPHPAIDAAPPDPDDEPDEDLGDQLGCEREGARGSIIIDDHHHTSVRNVFAAGDICSGAQIAIRAAAGGAVAAMSIHKSLVPPSRKLVEHA